MRPYTLVYDGDCRMCTRLTRALAEWDRGRVISIVSYQTPGVPEQFPWIPAGAYEQAIQLVGPDAQTWQGAAAIEKLLDILPRGRAIAWVFRVPFVRTLADVVYRWVARNRYRLGCGDHCPTRNSGL